MSPSLKRIIPEKGCHLSNTTPDAGHGTSTAQFEDEMSCRAAAVKSFKTHPVCPMTSRNRCRMPQKMLQVACLIAAACQRQPRRRVRIASGVHTGATRPASSFGAYRRPSSPLDQWSLPWNYCRDTFVSRLILYLMRAMEAAWLWM